jgi:hypothetical protein
MNFFKLSTLCLVPILLGNDPEKLVVDISYLPNSEYEIRSVNSSDGTMDFTGPEETISKIKGEMEFPVKIHSLQKSTMQAITGDKKNDAIPLTMNYTSWEGSTTVNGQRQEITDNPMDGLAFEGSFSNGRFELTSVTGPNLTEQMKTLMLSSVEELMQKSILPKKALAIGDTMVHVVPTKIPTTHGAIDVMARTTYKLISVANSKAEFSTDIEMVLSSEMEMGKFKIDGSGTGSMRYNIDKKFVESLASEANMKMIFNTDQFDIKYDMKVKLLMITTMK